MIELMLVLVVIGVMLSLVVVAVAPNPARELEREGRRLHALLQMAATEAMMQGVEIGLAVSANNGGAEAGYQFLVLNMEQLQWQSIAAEQFGFHVFKPGITISASTEGHRLDREMQQQLKRVQRLKSDTRGRLALVLLSSGEVSPFNITLRHQLLGRSVNISSDGISEIILR